MPNTTWASTVGQNLEEVKYENGIRACRTAWGGARGRSGRGRRVGAKGSARVIVATTNDIAGYRIVAHLGVCRGITVRSRSVVGNWAGGWQSLFGGRLSIYVRLAEKARQEAYDHMVAQATQAGANAVVGMRYDANEIMDGITEVLAYGTAVRVEPMA